MRFEIKVSTIVLVVLLGTSHGYLEHERNALLQLFSFFKINSSIIANTPNCCDWSWDGYDGTEGNTTNGYDYSLEIQCNDTEGRVTHLYLLSGEYQHGRKADLYLNTSLFLPFKGLRNLQLWALGIVGCAENEGFQRLSILENLESLSLYHNFFDSSIFTSQGLCELWHIRYLDLSSNDLSGSLPWCLANMTSLQELELFSNQISGHIDFSPIKSLTSLQGLEVRGNRFKVPISLAPFFNHSKLKSLDVTGNELYAQTEVKNLSPKFQLESLSMSGPVRNAVYPEFLYHQHNLRDVDLSDIPIMGEFPYWLLENNTHLGFLSLYNNSLSGELQLPIHPHRSLSILHISMNSIHGSIPDSLSHLSNLRFLDISDNNLSGSIPTSIGTLSSLKFLDLSENSLSGPLPTNFCSPYMIHLELSNNKLFGSLTEVFCDCSNLTTLDLHYNRFTGSIPDWLRRCSQLEFLLLSRNNLQGKIPVQLCALDQLNLIDLSHNNLSGHILPCLMSRSNSNIRKENDPDIYGNQPPLEFVEKGRSLTYEASILRYISGIDLSCNNFTGEIPPEIGNLSEIQVLNLSHNSLMGPIPLMFVNLKKIESLDLSYNKLYGEIPSQLTELNFLAAFSVAHNNLCGRIPEGVGQFATFNEGSYEGNPLLCGTPLTKRCYERMPRTSTENESEEDNGFMDMEAFYVSFLVSYIMVLLVIAAVLYINPYWRRLLFAFIDATTTKFYYLLLDSRSLLVIHGSNKA